MAKELTGIQQKILNFLLEQRAVKGILPSLAEIAQQFGYKNRATARQHLQSIEKKGFIKINPKKSRSIEITMEGKLFSQHPVIGEVAAGNPLTIYQDAIDTVQLPNVVVMPNDSFLLKVKGDSLKDAYIFNGDVVIVKPETEFSNGQIVVAVLEDAAVVKRLVLQHKSIELHSENPNFQPIIVDRGDPKFRMVGVVVGVYRTMAKKNMFS